MNNKNVMLVVGAGQISLAIARRMGYNSKIIIGDYNQSNAEQMGKIMTEAGFDIEAVQMDLGSRKSIQKFIDYGLQYGSITGMINGAGVSPSQAGIDDILRVDLYGTAVLLEEVGKVIESGGNGIVISSQSGHRMPALTVKQDAQLAILDPERLLSLNWLQKESIKDSLHAYQLAKRSNEKRVMGEAVKWGHHGARLNAIAPGILVTPLALDEFNGKNGEFYKNMFAKSPAGRPGTADEVANVAELLMSPKSSFITGSTFLVDGGATADYFYGNESE